MSDGWLEALPSVSPGKPSAAPAHSMCLDSSELKVGVAVGWNYRVMRHMHDPEGREREVWYAIHEVFYKDDGVDDRMVDSSETSYTQDPAVVAEDLDELRWILEQMLAALNKPVLDYRP